MNRWEMIQELFEQTVELEPEERSHILRERCGSETDIADEVEALVAAEVRNPGVFETPAFELLARRGTERWAPEPAESLEGVEVGAYRLAGIVSAGGMGAVYRATRSSGGVERSVAMKVLKRGLDTDALLARFHREQRTLAALDHDGIVAFLDAGALEDGRPFLVMELVEGVLITTWCALRRLSTRERVALFRNVLTAVQHAHQRLVVHRDLKPSNVLVTPSGKVKLLDFGVSTLLESESGVSRPTSAGEGTPFTPTYASPEQLRGEPVMAASDVYSLGALLYELLVGVPAFDGETSFDPDRVPSPASARAGSKAHSRELRGDLDRIVLKALAPEVEHRYATVQRFDDDLERYLKGLPVSARRPTLPYRCRKFVGRNPWPIVAGTCLFLALAMGFLGVEIGRQRAIADSRRGWSAHLEAKVAARYLEDVMVEIARDGPALEDILARREAEVDVRFENDPEAEGLVRLAFARLYIDRGFGERAVSHLDRVLALARTGSGLSPAEEKEARALMNLAVGR